MKVRDFHAIRKIDPETGAVSFETEERWLEVDDVLTEAEAIERERQEEEAYTEEAQRTEANKAKVRALTKHSDPAVAFLAAQLLTKL